MLRDRRHWLCDESRKRLGNNCYPAAADDIVGYLTKDKCESECLSGSSLAELHIILRSSGVKYPFDDLLDKMVADENLAAKFIKSINDDNDKFYAVFLFNIHDGPDDYYRSLAGQAGQIIFDYPILLHELEPGDAEALLRTSKKWFAEERSMRRVIEDLNKPSKTLQNPFSAAAAMKRATIDLIERKRRLSDKLYDDGTRIMHLLTKDPSGRNYYHIVDSLVVDALGLEKMEVKPINNYESEIKSLLDAGKIALLNVNLRFTWGGDHANSIIIDPNTAGGPTAFYFEPHVIAHWSKEMERVITNLFGGMFERLGIKKLSLWEMNCPIGLQSSDRAADWGSCAIWNGLIISMCIMNPQKTKSALLKILMSLRGQAYNLLHLFIFYITRQVRSGKDFDYDKPGDNKWAALNIWEFNNAIGAARKNATSEQNAMLDALRLRIDWHLLHANFMKAIRAAIDIIMSGAHPRMLDHMPEENRFFDMDYFDQRITELGF